MFDRRFDPGLIDQLPPGQVFFGQERDQPAFVVVMACQHGLPRLVQRDDRIVSHQPQLLRDGAGIARLRQPVPLESQNAPPVHGQHTDRFKIPGFHLLRRVLPYRIEKICGISAGQAAVPVADRRLAFRQTQQLRCLLSAHLHDDVPVFGLDLFRRQLFGKIDFGVGGEPVRVIEKDPDPPVAVHRQFSELCVGRDPGCRAVIILLNVHLVGQYGPQPGSRFAQHRAQLCFAVSGPALYIGMVHRDLVDRQPFRAGFHRPAVCKNGSFRIVEGPLAQPGVIVAHIKSRQIGIDGIAALCGIVL